MATFKTVKVSATVKDGELLATRPITHCVIGRVGNEKKQSFFDEYGESFNSCLALALLRKENEWDLEHHCSLPTMMESGVEVLLNLALILQMGFKGYLCQKIIFVIL